MATQTGERIELAVLAVDLVVAYTDPSKEAPDKVLLIRRESDPYRGCWALPGGRVHRDEQLVSAAMRELEEETGLTLDADDLTLVGVYGDPGRDPRGRVVSFVYTATVTDLPPVSGGDDAADARWWPLADVLAGRVPLAFDHDGIVDDATCHLS